MKSGCDWSGGREEVGTGCLLPWKQRGSRRAALSRSLWRQTRAPFGQGSRTCSPHSASLSATRRAGTPESPPKKTIGRLTNPNAQTLQWLQPVCVCCMRVCWENTTFSNLSLIGFGLVAVTASAISLPILKACSLVAPFSNTNMLPNTRGAAQSLNKPHQPAAHNDNQELLNSFQDLTMTAMTVLTY